MRIWLISALGVCIFFVAAMALGFSSGAEVRPSATNYVSTVFETAASTQVLPHGSLLLMLSGSFFLALLPAIYELHRGFQFKFKKRRENVGFGFSLARSRDIELGIPERELAEIGEITEGVVQELKQMAEKKRRELETA